MFGQALINWGSEQAGITRYEKKVLFLVSQVTNQGVEGLRCSGSCMESVAAISPRSPVCQGFNCSVSSSPC